MNITHHIILPIIILIILLIILQTRKSFGSNDERNNIYDISYRKDIYSHENFHFVQKRTDNSIFVSIASYRDKDCVNTILDCFHNSKYPQNITIGICQQNGEDDIDCIHNQYYDQLKPFLHQIKVIRIPYYEARGPTLARYLCSTLWDGESYYIQIDSHMRFEYEWDHKCISIYKQFDKKIVLSTYPKEIGKNENNDVPVICNAVLSESEGLISYPGATLLESPETPLETGFIAAGFFFTDSSFLNQIPFDPRLPDLFIGEEILLSIRFWTHGWDIYAPNQNIIYHHYTRNEEPKVWKDRHFNPDSAIKKVKKLIGLTEENIPNDLNIQMNIYGLGKSRTLSQFYEFIQFKYNDKKSNKNFCITMK